MANNTFALLFNATGITRTSGGGDVVLLQATRRTTNSGALDEEVPGRIVCGFATTPLLNDASDVFSLSQVIRDFFPGYTIDAPDTFTYFDNSALFGLTEEAESIRSGVDLEA